MLYSKLNVSNVSLNVILHGVIAVLKATTDNLPQILKINKAKMYIKTMQTNKRIP